MKISAHFLHFWASLHLRLFKSPLKLDRKLADSSMHRIKMIHPQPLPQPQKKKEKKGRKNHNLCTRNLIDNPCMLYKQIDFQSLVCFSSQIQHMMYI